MISTTFKTALCIVCYVLIATCDTIQLNDVEINDRQDDSMPQGGCPFILSIYYKKITDMENVIMKTLLDMNATLVTLKDSEEQQNSILIEMCVMEILSNRIDNAVSTFNLSGNDLSVSSIVGKIYVYGDLTLFELIVRFINKLEIKYTKINGITELYDLLIENNDFNIVNGIMLLNSVYASGKGGTQYIEKLLLKRLSQLSQYKDIELFFTFAQNFENDQLVLNMIPTFVSLIYAKSAKNIELVLELLHRFYYLNQKIYGTIALRKEIAVHKHSDENGALAVVCQIIYYKTLLGKHQLVVNNQPYLEMVEKSLPDNFLPFLHTDLCFLNKYYGRYLYVDSDDHVQHNLYRPILTRKIMNPSLMYTGRMKFGIHFQYREADCNNVVIGNVLHPIGEILFAENGTVFTYKGAFPDERKLQAEWHLEADGKYFRLKNQEYGTYLQMDEIIEGGGYEITLRDIELDWDSEKAKWKIEKCQIHLNIENDCQKL